MPDMPELIPPAGADDAPVDNAPVDNIAMPRTTSDAPGKTPTPQDLPNREFISDDRLKEATGRTRKQWFKALDKAGAQDWDHKHIARWLGGKQEVDGWWAQSVTVDYEYARGKRIYGQRSDGSFETNVSKSLRLTPADVWPLIDDDERRRAWLDCEFEVRGRTPGKSLRMEAADGSRINIALYALPDGVDGDPRTRVDITHSKLPSAQEIPETKAFWKSCLGELAGLVKAG